MTHRVIAVELIMVVGKSLFSVLFSFLFVLFLCFYSFAFSHASESGGDPCISEVVQALESFRKQLVKVYLPGIDSEEFLSLPIFVQGFEPDVFESPGGWKDKILKQGKEALTFLVNLYRNYAQVQAPFPIAEVMISPLHYWHGPQESIEKSGKTLIIRVAPPWSIFAFRRRLVQSAGALRRYWDEGKHLMNVIDRAQFTYLNPVSSFRSDIVDNLMSAGATLAKAIQRILGRHEQRSSASPSPNEESLLQALLDEVFSLLRVKIGGYFLNDAAIESLRNKRLSELVSLLRRWEESSEDESLAREVASEVVSEIQTFETQEDTTHNIKVISIGVAHGNEKDIKVIFNSSPLVRKTTQVLTTKRERNILVFGLLFAGYHQDFISVRVELQRTMETNALHLALTQTFGLGFNLDADRSPE